MHDVDSGATTAWALTVGSVDAVLTAYGASIPFGASYFPRGTGPDSCAIIEGLPIAPSVDNRGAIMRFLRTATQTGSSPLGPQLATVARYLRAHPTDLERVVVVATDGAGDCDHALDCRTCTCLVSDCRHDTAGCFDDAGVLAAIADLRAMDIRTALIGFEPEGTPEPLHSLALGLLRNAALAGGLATDAPRGYYPGDPSNFRQSLFEIVERSQRTCRFQTDQPLTDSATLWMGGEPLGRDESHVSGWDWSDREHGRLRVFGDACHRYQEERDLRLTTILPPARCGELPIRDR